MNGTPLVAPLFIEDQQRTSVVTMVNGAPDGVDADVVLYGFSGDLLAKRTISIGPHSQYVVNVADLLGGSRPQYGTVFVVPHRNSTMAAQLSIAGRNGAPVNDVEEDFPMLMGMQAANFRAVSASPDAIVAVHSLSSDRQTLLIACATENKNATRSLPIGPNQTIVIDACAEGGPLTTPDLSNLPASPPRAGKAVALSVSSSAPAADLAVFGLGLGGESGPAAIPFSDTGMLMSSTAVFPGVNVTAMDGLARFEATVANFSDAARTATISISEGNGPAAKTKIVDTLHLDPHGVAAEDLTGALHAAQTAASLVISSDGAPGDVVSNLQALRGPKSASSNTTLPWKDEHQFPNGGQHPWRIDGGFNSTLILYNPDSGKANSVKVSVYTGGKTWMKYFDVEPLSTVTVRIDDIVRKQQPDDHGNTLPPDATSGMVGWVTLANPKVLGLLAQRDSISGIVRPFACAETYAVCAIGVPDVNIAIDSFTGDLSPNVSTCGTNNDCNCVESCLNGGGNLSSYDWSSGNSSIASLTSNPSYSFGDYEGMGPGSTVSAVTAVDNLMCQVQGGGQLTVQIPTAVKFVTETSHQSLSSAACSQLGGSGQGFRRDVTLTVVDQGGAPIRQSGITMADTLKPGSPNDLGITAGSNGSVSTNLSGQWSDTYWVCSAVCPASSGQSVVAQSWKAGGTLLPTGNVIVYKCGSITIDGH
ncbi:MAG TPA: hypothetical protein VN579_06760 [Bryobacteraceae bacterium]|nr:hypothetical protein [Bryobacteraceae bacterium]